jgi:hypothetical protein
MEVCQAITYWRAKICLPFPTGGAAFWFRSSLGFYRTEFKRESIMEPKKIQKK